MNYYAERLGVIRSSKKSELKKSELTQILGNPLASSINWSFSAATKKLGGSILIAKTV